MDFNTKEQQAFATLAPLLAPDGTIEHSVLNKYLARFVAVHQNLGSNVGDQVLLGALLKHADTEHNQQAFTTFYEAFRSDLHLYDEDDENNVDDDSSPNNGTAPTQEKDMPLDAWLRDMSAARPDDLARWLTNAASAMDFTNQALILRDANKWLPHVKMATFVPPTLLSQKLPALFKNFIPDEQDLPYLVDAGMALVEQGPTAQHKALGDALMRCCFFSAYKTHRDYNDHYTWHCSASKAFELIKHTPLVNDYAQLLSQTQARLKQPTATLDALSFCVKVLQSQTSSADEKTNANSLVSVILDAEQEKDPEKRHLRSATHALCAVYNSTTQESTKERIVAYLDSHVHATRSSRFFEQHVDNLVLYSPALLDQLMATMQSKVTPPTWEYMLGKWLVQSPEHYYNESVVQIGVLSPKGGPVHVPYRVTCPNTDSSAKLFHKVSGPSLMAALQTELVASTEGASRGGRSSGGDHDDLFKMFSHLAEMPWTPEQMDHVKQSSWPATAVLFYLYLASDAESALDEYSVGSLPNTHWQPLPLMKKLYPEHAPLWRQMELGILDVPMDGDSEKQYRQVMGQLFDMFAKGFASDKMQLSHTKELIAGLGIAPLEYFQAHANVAQPTFELPDNMFNFS